MKELENKMFEALKEQLLSASQEVAKKYEGLARKIAKQAKILVERAIAGENIDDEKKFLAASLQNLVSASQAITISKAHKILQKVVEELIKIAVSALA